MTLSKSKFEELPLEIITTILDHLDTRTLIELSQVNRPLQELLTPRLDLHLESFAPLSEGRRKNLSSKTPSKTRMLFRILSSRYTRLIKTAYLYISEPATGGPIQENYLSALLEKISQVPNLESLFIRTSTRRGEILKRLEELFRAKNLQSVTVATSDYFSQIFPRLLHRYYDIGLMLTFTRQSQLKEFMEWRLTQTILPPETHIFGVIVQFGMHSDDFNRLLFRYYLSDTYPKHYPVVRRGDELVL